MTIKVGVAWSTHFQRAPLQIYPRLRYGYKPAGLFLQAMIEAGEDGDWVGCDEQLVATSFDPGGRGQLVDFLYVSSHGVTGATGFEVALHAGDWPLLGGGFGDDGPVVVVFDCCKLTDHRVAGWQKVFETAQLGQRLRLLLGFSNLASGSRKAAVRGTAFADELAKGLPIADAWRIAVQKTSVSREVPVAIAFGDDDADAKSVLDTMTIDPLRGPRAKVTPTVKARP